MGKITGLYKAFVRPQVLIALVAFGAVFGGWMLSHTRSVQSASAAATVEQPLSYQVQSAATVRQPVDCSKMACIALTFDDGPSSDVTPQVLDVLERHQAKATFFVLGSRVAGREDLLRRIHQDGYEIGNHSWSHSSFIKIPLAQVDDEIENTQEAIVKAGVPAPHLFRPPYGDINEAILAHIPLTVVRWNIDPEDWHPKQREHLLEHMSTHAKPGGMVVLHDTETNTATTLEALITDLEAQHYTLVTVSELLDLAPGQPGVFFGR
jgi:peptidoglycan/xylan/chitin deacetylase (PgdA/CDA1 family)